MQRLPEEEIRERVAEVLDLVERSFRGDHYRLLVRHADGLEMAFVVETMATDLPQPGESIRLRLRREAVTLLPPDLY